MSQHGTTATIAKRSTERPIDTAEIRALAESAGYEIAAEVTQVRPPDATAEFGPGKVEELAERVEATDSDVVIVDNDLDPSRAFALRDRLGCAVIDRERLVIDVFADRANTRRARLEVRLAELRYEQPLAEERARRGEASGHMGFKSRGESPADRIRANYRREIHALEAELDAIDSSDDEWRDARHEAGFDLVALAGYTNAGKSTLLRRLADELAVDENDGRHADLDRTAESQDRLFTTVDTTTRRATLDGRRLLVTDTVGFVSGLSRWLVDSFESTLAAAYDADAVCLVIDAADPVATVEAKTETSISIVRDHRDGGVLPVLNKADVADDLEEKRQIVADCTGVKPVVVSALDGHSLDALAERLTAHLPDQQEATLTLPPTDEGMALVSWIHDHTSVERVEYGEDVTITFAGRPETVTTATGRAKQL